jgi:hypothetical protein
VYAHVARSKATRLVSTTPSNMVRAGVESTDTPAGLEGATMLMLVNRETGCGPCPPRSTTAALAASAAPGRESAAARWEAGNGGDGSR